MSQVNTNSIYDASGGSNAVLYGVAAPANSMGFRNRIINGGMVIDQRNAGASLTPTSSTYTLDRWRFGCSQASKVSVQQSTSAPAGFTNSAQLTVGAAANVTVGASDEFWFQQRIEGFNVADMAFGTASAVTFTVSFWVNSSVTGTYAASFQNNATNYSYVSTFTISAANTWEYKTLTIPAPTAGTWTTDNTVGLYLAIDLGSGSSMNTTAGSWQSGYFRRTSGCVSWVTTNSATFRLTGVQLEAGTVASPFERRDYGRELIMCMRYFQKSFPQGTAPAQNAGTTGCAFGQSAAASGCAPAWVNFPVVMRATPSTVTTYNPSAANASWRNISAGSDVNSQLYSSSQTSIYLVGNTQTVGQYQITAIHYTADAEL